MEGGGDGCSGAVQGNVYYPVDKRADIGGKYDAPQLLLRLQTSSS